MWRRWSLARTRDDERGIAMITALLMSTVVLALGLVAIQLSVHSADSSVNDRRRVQAVDAAEAGLNQVLSYYRVATTAEVCAPPSTVANGVLTRGPGGPQIAEFSVTVSCDSMTKPRQVLLDATGWAPNQSSPRSVSRKMETLVNVKAISFLHAMFHGSSTVPLVIVNNTSGQQFANADVYSNADVILKNNANISGDVISQGSITMQNSAIVKAAVWARYGITMTNSAYIGGSATASSSGPGKPGNISLVTQARIAGNAKAAGTITTANNSAIDGARTPNSPSPPPPNQALPTFTWDPTDPWPPTISNFSACTGSGSFQTWFTANQSALSGTARISGTGSQANCAFTTPNNSTMALMGDMAIVNDGDVSLDGQNTWLSGDGSVHKLFLISINGNVNFANNTNFDSNLRVFVFTNHTANLQNQNMWYGQVYADVINATNYFPLTFQVTNPPGLSSSTAGFVVDTIYLREVKI